MSSDLVTQEDFLEGCSSGRYVWPHTFGIKFANGIYVGAYTESGRMVNATIRKDKEDELKRFLEEGK